MEVCDMVDVTDIIQKTEDTLENLWNQFELFCPKCLHFKVTLLLLLYLLHVYYMTGFSSGISALFLKSVQKFSISRFIPTLYT